MAPQSAYARGGRFVSAIPGAVVAMATVCFLVVVTSCASSSSGETTTHPRETTLRLGDTVSIPALKMTCGFKRHRTGPFGKLIATFRCSNAAGFFTSVRPAGAFDVAAFAVEVPRLKLVCSFDEDGPFACGDTVDGPLDVVWDRETVSVTDWDKYVAPKKSFTEGFPYGHRSWVYSFEHP